MVIPGVVKGLLSSSSGKRLRPGFCKVHIHGVSNTRSPFSFLDIWQYGAVLKLN